MPLFSHISRSNSVAGNAEISVSSISFPKSGAKSENKSGEGLRCLPLGKPSSRRPCRDGSPQPNKGLHMLEEGEENVSLNNCHMWGTFRCRYFLNSVFPGSWWMNVLVPISRLHEEQPTPQCRSGIWVGLPLNPIFCKTMSNNGPHVQFYNADLGI